MNDAKRNMRCVLTTLLDLKNAFGEVHHNLIRSSLKYHHVPNFFTDIFNIIYTHIYSHVSISVNNKWTEKLIVERGILQGDPCSPLLFNVCFNTLMHTLSKLELKGLGYIWGGGKSSTTTRSWLQFADDAIIISNSITDSKALLNVFSDWCKWANMIIRLDKCCCYGMMKANGTYGQFEPALYINNGKMPSVALGESFKYL